MNKFLPGFKTTCYLIGLSYIMMSLGLFMKGLLPSMAEFQVPQSTLDSPHYADAILWVYVHMIVIGMLIFMIGYAVKDVNKQKWITFFLLLITLFYTYLDFRSSDSSLGNGLYKGESFIIPALIGLFTNFLFLLLFVKLLGKKKTA